MTIHTDNNTETATKTTTKESSVPAWLNSKTADTKGGKTFGKGKGFGVVAGVALAALIASYAFGVRYYTTHFLPGTIVGGVNVSNLAVDEIAKRVEENVGSYTNHVTGDGLDFTVMASDIQLTTDGKAYAEDAHAESNPYLWPIDLFKQTSVTPDVGVTYDKELLSAFVTEKVEAFNTTAEAPTDATASYDAKQGTFVLVPSALGTEVDVEDAVELVNKSVSSLHTTAKLGEEQLQRPAVEDDDKRLAAAIEQANSMITTSIPLTLDGATVYTVDPSLVAGWVYVSETDEGEPAAFVDKDAILSWSYATLNDVVNGENETKTWEVNSWDTAEAIAPRIYATDSSALEVPTIITATRPEESEGHEAYGRHIDVNLSTQYARLYDSDGKTVLWRSPFVSGNAAMGHDTPTGEWEINNMEQGVTLSGLNDGVVLEPGEEPKPEDFYNSYVNYWMCFIGTEYGLHDATWRYDEEFGGDTYLWNGSHGCINLPYDSAASLYELVHVGDKVIIHY